jgi:hypothetical protein
MHADYHRAGMRFRRRRPPILEVISAWTDGPPPDLPDEPPDDGRTIRWSAGALDGVVARLGDASEETERGAALAELIEQAATGDPGARGALYDAARGDGIVFALDAALQALAEAGVPAEPVAELAREMIAEAYHREPLKLAISLLGRAGDDRDVELLETLARHDEFSLVAGVALAGVLDDPVQAWWRVGCLASGWGRVEAVGRLAELAEELPDDTRAWLLRHACRTADLPDHVAYECATAGRLEHALDGLVDDELLDGACAILSALVGGGPTADMDDYEPGPRVAAAVLDLLAGRPPNLVRMWAVVDLRNWAEDYEQHVAIAERCNRLLARAEARRFVAARLERPDEALRVWGIAESMGLDPWEAGWRHLDVRGVDSRLYGQLARTPHPARWARLMAHAERALPLDALAAGPEDRLLPTTRDGEAAHALAGLVQEMRPGRWSAPLVAAALLSPVIFIRNGALRALEQTEPREWGAPVEAALHRLIELEPTDEVRARANVQMGRLA